MATGLELAGVPRAVTADILGHADGDGVTAIDIKPTVADLSFWANRVGLPIIPPTPSDNVVVFARQPETGLKTGLAW